MPTCSVQGCSRPSDCRSWCGTHYKRWRKYGSLDLPPRPNERVSAEEATRLYRDGASAKDLGLRYGVDPQTVQRVLAQAGVPLRGKRKTPAQRQRLSETHRRFHVEEKRLRELRDQGMSTREIGQHLDVPAEVVRERMVELGIPRLAPKARTEHNHFYRRGWTIDKHGYLLTKASDHPHANRAGYVRQHRLAMEEELGRYLAPEEVVHHIDGDPQNNALENLRLYASNADHLREEWARPSSRMRQADRRRKSQRSSTRPGSESDARP